MDVPFPPLYAKREKIDGKAFYRIVDGGHRCETFRSYINNEWAAGKCEPITFFNEVTGEYEVIDISFKLFSELAPAVKEKILSTSFQMIFFDNMTHDEEVELFRRLNSGKPLSAKEKTVANVKDIDVVLQIGQHPIFKEIMTEKAIIKKSYVGMIMKIWCMLNLDINKLSFDTKAFTDIICKVEITDEEKDEICKVLDYLQEVHRRLIGYGYDVSAKKIYTETHLVSIIPFIEEVMKSGISISTVAEWLESFYGTKNGASVSAEYNAATRSGVAKTVSIIARNLALKGSFEDFFSKE